MSVAVLCPPGYRPSGRPSVTVSTEIERERAVNIRVSATRQTVGVATGCNRLKQARRAPNGRRRSPNGRSPESLSMAVGADEDAPDGQTVEFSHIPLSLALI
jgi:hypothetical protein